MRRCASVDHVVGRILMRVLQRNGALHAMDEEETSPKQVFPRAGKSCEDEEPPKAIVGVVGGAPRSGLRRYSCIEWWRDPDEEELDALGRRIRLLPDVARNASMTTADLTGADRVLNL